MANNSTGEATKFYFKIYGKKDTDELIEVLKITFPE